MEALRALSPEGRDALLYACSAVFAAVTAFAVGIPLYRQWGQMAVGPYAAAGVVMAVVAVRIRSGERPAGQETTTPVDRDRTQGPVGASPSVRGPQRWRVARVVAFLIVLFGATIVPLGLEVVWRSEGQAALHVQPEVVVVEQAGNRAAHGRDPYRVVDQDGQHPHPPAHRAGLRALLPYLPGMVVFGFSTGSKVEARLTDARIQFLLFTAVIALLALSRLRPPTDARVRALQVLTVLPTAALPLATGGDDMPVVALMLLGPGGAEATTAAAGRAGPGGGVVAQVHGLAAGPVGPAGPPPTLRNRRAMGRYALGVLAVMGPVVLPVALRNPSAFVDNVIRFPLGLAGVSSPAASALPGHILVAAFPGIHRIYVVAAVVAGRSGPALAAVAAPAPERRPGGQPVRMGHARRHPPGPGHPGGLPALPDQPVRLGLDAPARPTIRRCRRRTPLDQLSSGSSNSSSENVVVPAEVVGDTVAPTSQ